MLKKLVSLAMAGGVCLAPGVQAAAISDMGITLNWGSMAISGPLGSPATITDPATGEVLSSSAEGWVGANSINRGDAYAINGASAIATYTDSAVDVIGGYDASFNEGGGGAFVTNTGIGVQSGWGGGYRGFVYQAGGDGAVTVSVSYSLFGSVSTTTPYEYANGGYSYFMDAVNADQWISTYQSAIAAGSSATDAENAADLAAVLYTSGFSDWQLIESPGCWLAASCSSSVDQSGVLSMTFDVESGKKYFFGFDATASAYTQVNAVPVPAAAWLLGSGLIGLAGIAARKRKVA